MRFPVYALPKQKRAVHRKMRNPHGLKVRIYAACLFDLIKYLDVLPGEKASEKLWDRVKWNFVEHHA